jgi:hypothetical protein
MEGTMFVDDKPEVQNIQNKLLAAIDWGHDDFGDVLTALVYVFTHCIALACPDCRKGIARQLRKRIPQMLADANQLAAEASSDREYKHFAQ